MSLVYSYEHHTFRVDGDVLETFLNGSSEQRVMLRWLLVRVTPRAKGKFALNIGSGSPDQPVYQVMPRVGASFGFSGSSLLLYINPEEEPAIREFFTQVALLADRQVAP
jgi:hypothetical protein